ncbi:MAG: hypothetical protein ACI4L6_00490 [Candidatus Onthoplasma sp.]
MQVVRFVICLPKSYEPDSGKRNIYFPADDQTSFCKKLGELRRQKINVKPYVDVGKSNKTNDSPWIPYNDYKKLIKEGSV